MVDLTTVDAVKKYLGITSASDDSLLASLITAASGYIQTFINRVFEVQEYVDKFSGHGNNTWMLRNYPCKTVSIVTINGNTIYPAATATGFGYVYDDISVTVRGHAFLKGALNCAITYQAGYDNVPAEIAQACIELVSLRYKEKDRIGLISKGLAGETISYSQNDMSTAIKTILLNYKKIY
jgi:hypothetical protein